MANKLNVRKTPKAAIDPDPIFAAIVEHKSLWEKWSLLEEEINNIEEAESEKSRDRPVELIAWRGYSKATTRSTESLPRPVARVVEGGAGSAHERVRSSPRSFRRLLRVWVELPDVLPRVPK